MRRKRAGEVEVRPSKQTKQRKVVKLESLKQLNLNAAGLDIGAAEIYAAVPEERAEQSVRSFATFTADLHALADWLAACGVETVAMESTSVYWVPVYEILAARGFDLYLVNAQQVKHVPGRKSDVLDCQWLQQLHTYGLLRGSFRPSQAICELRTILRHRSNLIEYRAGHIQHMQKALNLMNLHLTNVISDITGLTGMKIVRAIVAGERACDGRAEVPGGPRDQDDRLPGATCTRLGSTIRHPDPRACRVPRSAARAVMRASQMLCKNCEGSANVAGGWAQRYR